MHRHKILQLLSESINFWGFPAPLSCRQIAKKIGDPRAFLPSYHASLSTQLRRLWGYGLERRKLDKSLRPRHGGRGVFTWTITEKGLRRLSWAKEMGKIQKIK